MDQRLGQPWLEISKSYGHAVRQLSPPRDGLRRHAGSWIDFDGLGGAQPYQKTFDFDGPYASATHEFLAKCPGGAGGLPFLIDIGIEGFLLRDDALKLYELSYFANGDVLELGTHKGLSTSILASALHDRGMGVLETVDIDEAANRIARSNLRSRPGSQRITFTLKDAALRMDELIDLGRHYGFIFVDHWHGYEATLQAATRVSKLLQPGGVAAYHDFLDAGNAAVDHVYGVYQAVLTAVANDPTMEFLGNFGCCGCFRKALI